MKCLIILVRYNRPAEIFNPNNETKNYDYAPPIGLAYISAYLKQHNHSINFLNLNHLDGNVERLIRDELSKDRYDFVLTGGISPFYPDIKHCVEIVRIYSPDSKIILGGGLISSQPEIMFNLLQPDYGIIGEGEITINQLFECIDKGLDIKSIPGLIFCDSEKKIIITQPRDPINNLDLLPWPDYDGLGYDEYLDHTFPNNFYSLFDSLRIYPIIASRSCPFSCTFCFHPLGKKYRKRSIENIMDELKYAIIRYHINIIIFYDELLATDRTRIYDLCRRLSEFLKTLPWEVKWSCQMRVDVIDEEMIATMQNAGCYFISLGLESYSPSVLKNMNKVITPEQIDRALRICAHYDMGITGNFIFGDPAETVETYRETLKYWKENDDIIRNQINLTLITIFQGSPLYNYVLNKGIVNDEIAFIQERALKGYLPINFTDKMTDTEFEKMQEEINETKEFFRRYSIPLCDKENHGLHEIHVKCPYCNTVSIYRNIVLPPHYSNAQLVCKKCLARIILLSKKGKMGVLIFRLFGYKNGTKIIRYLISPVLNSIRHLIK